MWLGIEINVKNGFLRIPTEKLSALKNLVVLLIEKLLPYTTALELRKTSGKLISTKFVFIDKVKTKN